MYYLKILLIIGLFLFTGCNEKPGTPNTTIKEDAAFEQSIAHSATTYGKQYSPLIRRSDKPSAGIEYIRDNHAGLYTGAYKIIIDSEKCLLKYGSMDIGLVLRPLGSQLNLIPFTNQITALNESGRSGIQLNGSTTWSDFILKLWVYPHNPGLIHYSVELTPGTAPPSGQIRPEWSFAESQSGTEILAEYSVYSDRAPGAAPCIYGYLEKMDSTLLYWLDLTSLNPFMEAVHFSPAGTPVRRGNSFGHNLSWTDIRRLQPDRGTVIYDSYLYLVPGEPDNETELFRRYVHQVCDIYDLLDRPSDPLPDWQALAKKTLSALKDPDTWIKLNGKRYWRAYVCDTRESAEAITQLDVGLAIARYIARYGEDEEAIPILADTIVSLKDFYNPEYGLIQNSGPVIQSGSQDRGDTWYELGHALKAAEWGLLGYDEPAVLARKSRSAWIDFARTVSYRFPQFYTFNTWQGMGREPDAAGGYALYMLRLADLSPDTAIADLCLQEAMSAVRSFRGYGFTFAYETHMTAAAALAAAELSRITNNAAWLDYTFGPIANLIRLSWIYECEYGKAASARTFFGLSPTQRAAAITAKEQYEAWIYLREFIRIAHGKVDPSIEKMVAEFCYHTLVTLAYSLPPNLPEGVAAENPAAYETVRKNRLDLYIPIEDMRDGWDLWGAIGQEVYGAGMALTFAALAYEYIEPGITVYSGYPIAVIQGTEVTFSGVPGTFTPVLISGCCGVLDSKGNQVDTEAKGHKLFFYAEGGNTYYLNPS